MIFDVSCKNSLFISEWFFINVSILKEENIIYQKKKRVSTDPGEWIRSDLIRLEQPTKFYGNTDCGHTNGSDGRILFSYLSTS